MKTVLVVDDNKYHLLFYEQELALEGYNIVTAKDGCEALKKIEEHSPDLVVLDIIMPKIGGIELMGRILSEHKKIPVIINTVYIGYMDNFISWAVDAYIIKSSDLTELKNKIKELLGKSNWIL